MKHRTLAGLSVLLAAIALPAPVPAQDAAAVKTWPGVKADRAAREVRIEARATGIRNKVPTEFFLIYRDSGHGYEAIAVTDAKPSDIHQALEFIGLQPGRPVDPAAFRFHPRGPRVDLWFETQEKDGPRRIRVEDTIMDRRTTKGLPPEGFVFTGSVRVPRQDDPTKTDYAADVYEPNSIVSAYNLRGTVLDIPREGSQGALYDFQFVNDQSLFATNAPLTVIARPAPEVREVEVEVSLVRAPADQPDAVEAVLSGPVVKPEAALKGADLTAALDVLQKDGRLVFLTLCIARGTPLNALGGAVAWMDPLIKKGFALEPPPPGELYYKAFAPNPKWRDRANRPGQPWELRLRETDGKVSGTLVKVEEDRDLLTQKIVYKTQEFPVATPEALRAALDQHGPGLRVMLISAPATMTYGVLADFVRPALTTHSTVYIFPE